MIQENLNITLHSIKNGRLYSLVLPYGCEWAEIYKVMAEFSAKVTELQIAKEAEAKRFEEEKKRAESQENQSSPVECSEPQCTMDIGEIQEQAPA